MLLAGKVLYDLLSTKKVSNLRYEVEVRGFFCSKFNTNLFLMFNKSHLILDFEFTMFTIRWSKTQK